LLIELITKGAIKACEWPDKPPVKLKRKAPKRAVIKVVRSACELHESSRLLKVATERAAADGVIDQEEKAELDELRDRIDRSEREFDAGCGSIQK
jgi:tellurite resistance protein